MKACLTMICHSFFPLAAMWFLTIPKLLQLWSSSHWVLQSPWGETSKHEAPSWEPLFPPLVHDHFLQSHSSGSGCGRFSGGLSICRCKVAWPSWWSFSSPALKSGPGGVKTGSDFLRFGQVYHSFGAFHKWGYPQIIHVCRIFPAKKPSNVGYTHFKKPFDGVCWASNSSGPRWHRLYMSMQYFPSHEKEKYSSSQWLWVFLCGERNAGVSFKTY